jgi:hypothetical protein
MISFLLLLTGFASAAIAPECKDTAADGPPSDYTEENQQSFLLNYFALSAAFTPIHAPIPNPPGTGDAGVEISIIPPLGCDRRLVLNYTKTEDTNKSPAIPRPRMSFSFPAASLGNMKVVPYGGLGYVPPLKVAGMQNVIVSMEAGVGMKPKNKSKKWQMGLRYHATLMKTIAEIATPFNEEDPTKEDLYIGSTFGVDSMFGYQIKSWVPYASVGFTDVSTFFYIDDDAVTTNNENPYQGVVISMGTQWRPKKWLVVGGEFYAAPGVIYTGRLRFAYRFH